MYISNSLQLQLHAIYKFESIHSRMTMTKQKEDLEQIHMRHSYRWKTRKSGPWMRKEEKPT
jgi:hypothetical protein